MGAVPGDAVAFDFRICMVRAATIQTAPAGLIIAFVGDDAVYVERLAEPHYLSPPI